MRNALVLVVGLLMLASGCMGTAGAPSKPFVEPQTGITFPVTLGPLALKSTGAFDKPELGVEIMYQAAGDAPQARAHIFVYDLGKKNLAAGADSEDAKAAFEQAKGDIAAMATSGRYKALKLVSEKPYALKAGNKAVPMLSAAYQYTFVPDPTKGGQERAVTSHLFLTVYKGQFLKVRLMCFDPAKDEALVKDVMAALGEAMK
jgi:hypothetical protein